VEALEHPIMLPTANSAISVMKSFSVRICFL
jgi:hypothetical protein